MTATVEKQVLSARGEAAVITPHGKLALLVGLMVLVAVVGLSVGKIHIPPLTVLKILLSRFFPIPVTWPDSLDSVVMDVRLPRVAAGLLVGAGLSISGAAFQGVFRNPLVSPHILGVAAGAGFGAAVAILFFHSMVIIQLMSFVFGLVAVGLTYTISRYRSMTPILMLVLSGIVVGALFSALVSFVKYIADPMNKMPAIVFWLLGSLNHVSNGDLVVVLPVFVGCIGLLLSVRWRINLLAMGDEDARALGVNTETLKALIILCATTLTAASVCISGIIGWIGIVIPHIGRMLVGSDNRHLLPVSMLTGAAYLAAVDLVARTALVTEIPIGILTAIIGAPIFVVLLRRSRAGE
jgi:iron complex transport system permease protein